MTNVVTPLKRVSAIYPAPTLDTHGRPADWAPSSTVTRELGWYEVIVAGVNTSWLRGIQVFVHTFTRTQPFGSAVADIEWPGITGHEALGVGDRAPFKAGADVDIRIVNSAGHIQKVFEGLITSDDITNSGQPGSDRLRMTITGALYQADLAKDLPPISTPVSIDAGYKIADLLNAVITRNFATCSRRKTKIPCLHAGAGQDVLTGSVQDILATMTLDDGSNAWTVDCLDGRRPVIRKKNMTTVHWNMRHGQPGLTESVKLDWTQFPTTIYGSGVAPNGFSWRNAKFPYLHPDPAPIFPLHGTAVFNPGDGRLGFRVFAQRMRQHGFPMYSVNTYSSKDAVQVRHFQIRAGLAVDGQVGPQTWNALFDVGSNSGSLKGAHISPLATLMTVEPRLEGADGHDRGRNPTFNSHALRVERFENMGTGITKNQGLRSARAELARDGSGCLVGTLTLTADPNEGSRRLIREGQNIKVWGLRGRNVLFHISSVQVNEDSSPATVSLTVSEKAHDLMTIAAIITRNKDNTDPTRKPQGGRRSSRVVNDTHVVFDGENGAGIIPAHRLYGGLWTVIRIPLGDNIDVVKTLFKTSGPHCIFAVGIFGSKVTPHWLDRHVGNPLTATASWTQGSVSLRKMAWVVSWGDKDQPGGYSPKLKSTPHAPITGQLLDESTWHFDAQHAPWLYIAEFAPVSTTISGRLYVAPQ